MLINNKEVNIDTDHLNLSFYGEIELFELKKLTQFKKLKHLNLSSSDLLDKHLMLVGQVKTIELLDLDSTQITDSGLRNLRYLKQLRELRLKDNPQLTNECIEFLSDIVQLELIHLENTSITRLGLIKLLTQKKLKSVILGSEFDTEVDELRRISEVYPTLEITVKGNGDIKRKTELI